MNDGKMFGWIALSLFCGSTNVLAQDDMAFEMDLASGVSTDDAGTTNAGRSFGASWGDYNGDGAPDLWISNHSNQPILYRNGKDASGNLVFTDIVPGANAGLFVGLDGHGTAFGDINSDGLQDFVQTAGANGGDAGEANVAVMGSSDLSPLMADKAVDIGLGYAEGRSRQLTWLDWESDGDLDAFISTIDRSDANGIVPLSESRLLLQTAPNTFEPSTDVIEISPSLFAQVSDLFADGDRYLLIHTQFDPGYPASVYRLGDITPVPKTELGDLFLPNANGVEKGIFKVRDVAIADFDNDGDQDIYLARMRTAASEVRVVAPELLTIPNGDVYYYDGQSRMNLTNKPDCLAILSGAPWSDMNSRSLSWNEWQDHYLVLPVDNNKECGHKLIKAYLNQDASSGIEETLSFTAASDAITITVGPDWELKDELGQPAIFTDRGTLLVTETGDHAFQFTVNRTDPQHTDWMEQPQGINVAYVNGQWQISARGNLARTYLQVDGEGLTALVHNFGELPGEVDASLVLAQEDKMLVNQYRSPTSTTLGAKEFKRQGVKIMDPSGVVANLAPTQCDSVTVGDFDNDMDVDVYMACRSQVDNSANLMLINNGVDASGKVIFVMATALRRATGSLEGRADTVSTADYNMDGKLDLFLTNGTGENPFTDGPSELLTNTLANDNNWLQIDLTGHHANRDGIGARVVVEAGGVSQTRELNGGIHRAAQDYKRLHFGLGTNNTVDSVTVYWPTGDVTLEENVAVNQILAIDDIPGDFIQLLNNDLYYVLNGQRQNFTNDTACSEKAFAAGLVGDPITWSDWRNNYQTLPVMNGDCPVP